MVFFCFGLKFITMDVIFGLGKKQFGDTVNLSILFNL